MSAPTPTDKAAQLASLIAASESTATQTKYKMILFGVLVIAVIVGGYFVYQKLTSSSSSADDSLAPKGPGGPSGQSSQTSTVVCKANEQSVTCKGKTICAPICVAPQVLSCS